MKIRFTTLLMMLCVLLINIQASVVTYTADDTSIFPNPERGFIDQLEKRVSKSSPNVVKGNESYFTQSGERASQRLVLVLYYLDNFRSTATLPDEILNAFDQDMQVLRDKGYKCILRYAYTNSNSGDTGKDAPLSTVKSHISQLKPYWKKNADVIYVLQAGFVGAWGEWYYTQNFGNMQGGMNADRIELVKTLLDAMPKDRYIQMRTPAHKIGFVGDEKPLTFAEAFSESDRARLAHHNDAVLCSYGYDMGTYEIKRNGSYTEDTTTLKPYIAQETLFVPIGGESCITDDSEAAISGTFANTTAEFSRLHWTFCKASYSRTVTDKWRKEGTYDELDRKMGYRYQLVSASLPDNAVAGGKVSISIKVRNTGYAPLYNKRNAYIVLKSGSKTYSVKLAADPRRWLPNGEVSTISEQITIPSNVAEGTYQLYINMPDAYESLAGNPDYSVRFANTDVWEASTGMNKLNATIAVTNSGQSSTDPDFADKAVALPTTLNKGNVYNYSEDMTWYNQDYLDFGPEDAMNLGRWAQWAVQLTHPGKYIISEEMASPEEVGHSWSLELLDGGGNLIAEYATKPIWEAGTLTYEYIWDLSEVAEGYYLIRVTNVMEWAQPKLKSITLEYDGDINAATETLLPEDINAPMYDMLGRRVGADYKGIVIQNGKKRMILRQ